MGLKHHKRTRAEILAKRFELDVAVGRGRIRLQRIKSRSKYTPHIGAKEQERATRCRMDYLHGSPRVHNDNERSAPIICQLSRS
jgi:hypothetical protein